MDSNQKLQQAAYTWRRLKNVLVKMKTKTNISKQVEKWWNDIANECGYVTISKMQNEFTVTKRFFL